MERRDNDTFWLEFDPTLPMTLESNRLLLPYAASAETKDDVPFYVHKYRGCSSMLKPSGHNRDPTSYKNAANKFCDSYMANHPKSEWFLWDSPTQGAAEMKHGVEACYECHLPTNIESVKSFPTLSMGDVVKQIPSIISVLDIDAQGADLEIIKSMESSSLKQVELIKFECQDASSLIPYLYETNIPNSCQDAQSYLESLGFEIVNATLNNCGCAEYNLFMRNKNPIV